MPKLIKSLIDSSFPKERDYIVWDDEIKGFGCRILPSGYKTYVYHYRSPLTGKRSYVKIGVHGNITCDQARKKALGYSSDVHFSGKDPKGEKESKELKDQQGILFEDFWKVFTERYINEKHKPLTIQIGSYKIKKYILPFFGKKIISEITQRDILNFRDFLSHFKTTCTLSLRLLTTAFNQAELWGYRSSNSNPCKGVPKYLCKKKERFLKDEELAQLENIFTERAEIGIASSYTLAAYRLLIYTGCRKNEVLTLKWKEVDFKHNCLRLPATKTGERVIPLNEIAKNIILGIPKKEDNPYVFCGKRPGQHLVAVQKTWERIRKKAGMPDVRIHDLRHSFASFAINNANLDLIEIQKLLGHKSVKTTERYVHLTDKKLLDATNRIFQLTEENKT